MISLKIFTGIGIVACIFLVYVLNALWRDLHHIRKGRRVQITKLSRKPNFDTNKLFVMSKTGSTVKGRKTGSGRL